MHARYEIVKPSESFFQSVDVIIPNYNRTDKVKRAIESAASDECTNKVFLVDDGSNEETLQYYLTLKQPKLEVISLQHTGDPGVVRNQAIFVSRAHWVAFLDSDDFWQPEKLLIQLRHMSKNDSKFSCFYNSSFFNEDLSSHTKMIKKPSDLMWSNLVTTSGVVIDRNLIISVGGFAEGSEVKYFEDLATWIKILGQSNLLLINGNFVCRDSSEDSYGRFLSPNFRGKLQKFYIRWLFFSGIFRKSTALVKAADFLLNEIYRSIVFTLRRIKNYF